MTTMPMASWFDPRGRLSRRAYGRWFIRLSLLTVALICVTIWVGMQGWREAAFVVAGCAVLLWFATLPLVVRRLHDRDRTGWWLALYLVFAALGAVPLEKAVDTYPIPVLAFAIASAAYTLWFLVETLGRRGTPGANRFGDPPQA